MIAATKRRPGLTLVELLVVLAILAILTTIAVTATDMVVDQARYDATVRTMQSIQDAIVGPANQRAADGTAQVSGFVADTGRLPLADLSDLISPVNLAPFQLSLPSGAPATMPSTAAGWNGPYLALPYQSLVPKDGWGNPIHFDIATGTIVSYGADNIADGAGGDTTGYNKDIVFTLPTTTGIIQGRVQVQDAATMMTPQPTPRDPTAADGVITLHFVGANPDPATSLPLPILASIWPPATATAGVGVQFRLAALPDATLGMKLGIQNGATVVPLGPPASPRVGPRLLWASLKKAGVTAPALSPYTRVVVRAGTNDVGDLLIKLP